MNIEPEPEQALDSQINGNNNVAKVESFEGSKNGPLAWTFAMAALAYGAIGYMCYNIGYMNGDIAAREKARVVAAEQDKLKAQQDTVEGNSREIRDRVYKITREQFWADKDLSEIVTLQFGLAPSVHAYISMVESENIETLKTSLANTIWGPNSDSLNYVLTVASEQEFKNPALKKDMIQVLVDHGAKPFSSTIDALIEQERPDLLAIVLKNSEEIWVSITFNSVMNHTFKNPAVKTQMARIALERGVFKPSGDEIATLIAQGMSDVLPMALGLADKDSIPEDALFRVVVSDKFPDEQSQRDMMRAFIVKGAKAGPRTIGAIASRNRDDLYDMAVSALVDSLPGIYLEDNESVINSVLRAVLFGGIQSGNKALVSFAFEHGVILSKAQAYYYSSTAKEVGQPDIAKIIADRTKTPAAPNPLPAP